LGDVTAG